MIPKYLIVILNEWTDPKECGDPQVFDDPKEIAIGSMDFNDPKVYGESPSVMPPSSMILFYQRLPYQITQRTMKPSS